VTEQEYLNSISSRVDSDYPAVIKVSEPLLIRYNKKSLLVNDTNFYVKIKYGLGFTGFYIYSSGLGTEIATVKRDDLKPKSGGTTKTDEKILKELEDGAAELLDILEARIATAVNDNAIKRAIDRLTWQQHYDITQSKTDFVTAFEDEGFSDDMTIDTDEAALTEQNSVRTVWYSVNKVATNLRSDDKDDQGHFVEYTISKALRDKEDRGVYGSEVRSVSCSVKLQTDLEEQKFVEISDTKLGNFGGDAGNNEKYRTLFDSMNSKVGQNYTGYSVSTYKTLDQVVGDDTTTSSKYDTGIIDKLGKFGDNIPGIGGSYQYRTLFETFNTKYTDKGLTVYKGYSDIGYKSLNETVGYVNTSDVDMSDKKSIYTKCTKTVSDSISTDTSNTDTVFGKINTVSSNIGDHTEQAGTDSLFAMSKTISDIKLGKFGEGSYRTLFDTFNPKNISGGYDGYSNPNFQTVYESIGDKNSNNVQISQYNGKTSLWSKLDKFDYTFYYNTDSPTITASTKLIRVIGGGYTPCVVSYSSSTTWNSA
jgi:hypothetical protein